MGSLNKRLSELNIKCFAAGPILIQSKRNFSQLVLRLPHSHKEVV